MKHNYIEMKCDRCGSEYACYMRIHSAFILPTTCPCVDSNVAGWEKISDSSTLYELPEGYLNEE